MPVSEAGWEFDKKFARTATTLKVLDHYGFKPKRITLGETEVLRIPEFKVQRNHQTAA